MLTKKEGGARKKSVWWRQPQSPEKVTFLSQKLVSWGVGEGVHVCENR